MSLRENIDYLAKQKHITLATVEKDLKLTKICRWSENIPSVDKVLSVAQYFGVSVEFLCTGSDSIKVNKKEVSVEAMEIASAFDEASEDDKEVIRTVLRKYKKETAASAS